MQKPQVLCRSQQLRRSYVGISNFIRSRTDQRLWPNNPFESYNTFKLSQSRQSSSFRTNTKESPPAPVTEFPTPPAEGLTAGILDSAESKHSIHDKQNAEANQSTVVGPHGGKLTYKQPRREEHIYRSGTRRHRPVKHRAGRGLSGRLSTQDDVDGWEKNYSERRKSSHTRQLF